MKKVCIALFLALALTACGGASSSAAPEATAAPEPTAAPVESAPPEADGAAMPEEPAPSAYLSELVDKLYEAYPVELMMIETRAVDTADTDWLRYQTGLGAEWADKISEAVVSESMTGSQAYSLVLVRTAAPEDAEAVAAAMLEGIDMVKWVCVSADRARAVTFDDVALLAMADSSLVDIDALVDALPAAAGVEFDYDMARQDTVD